MDGADPSDLARRDDLIRRQMAERTERQGWVLYLGCSPARPAHSEPQLMAHPASVITVPW
jgi:hypothetical protein